MLELTDGGSFGEVALLENCVRNATIKCKTECHFAILSSSEFINILCIY